MDNEKLSEVKEASRMVSRAMFFERCREFYPRGALGKKCLRVVIDGEKLDLGIDHGYRGSEFTDFNIFPVGHRYSRKNLILAEDGGFYECRSGIIPSFDAANHEPRFCSVNEVIFDQIIAQVNAKIERRVRNNRNKLD